MGKRMWEQKPKKEKRIGYPFYNKIMYSESIIAALFGDWEAYNKKIIHNNRFMELPYLQAIQEEKEVEVDGQ